MARTQHDREREREKDEQNEQGNRDTEAPTRLRRVGSRQRRRRLGCLAAAVARQHVLLVDPQSARVGAQKPADEHIGRQGAELVVFQLMQNADGDARGLSELRDRNLPLLSFPLQVASK